MAEGVVIRPERDADHPVIAEVVRAAFVGHPDEVASFVERIRASEQVEAFLAGGFLWPAMTPSLRSARPVRRLA